MRARPSDDGVVPAPWRHGAGPHARAHRGAAFLVGLLIAISVGSAAGDEGAPVPGVVPARLAELSQLNARVRRLHWSGLSAEALPDARRLVALAEQVYGPTSPMLAAHVGLLAQVLGTLGAYAEAGPLFERALALAEAGAASAAASPLAQSVAHVALAAALHGLASLRRDLGAYAEARPLYDRALASWEKALGPDHPKSAATLGALAQLLEAQGAHAEARPLLERALAIAEKAFGPDHPEVAAGLCNLAGILEAQGAYAEARPLLDRALAIRERALGPDHPDVGLSLNNLAVLLKAQGAYAEARPLLERALAIQERALGPDHPDLAASLNNLAVLLRAQGAYAEAQPLFERAVAILEKALGPHHPHVATSLRSLAALLQDRGALSEARPLLERALAIRERALGPRHPNVAMILGDLAGLAHYQGAYAEARRLYGRALAIQEMALSPDHPEIARILGDLAGLLREQGAYAEARPLLERALAIEEQALGPDHPDVATALGNLAGILQEQGDFAGARPLLDRALAIQEKALGPDHVGVAAKLNNLALLLQAQGDDAEARPLLERALAIQEKAFGPHHPHVATLVGNLAALLSTQGAYAEARPLFDRALAIYEQALGPNHPRVARTLGNLAAMLDGMGDHAAIPPLLHRALATAESTLRSQLAALSAAQRIAFLRTTRDPLDDWLLVAPRTGATGHAEALRFRGLVTRAEAAERALSRRGSAADQKALVELHAATRRAARIANEVSTSRAPEARATWQKRLAEANAERERLTRELTSRIAPARVALERLDLTALDVQRALPADGALVELLRVRDRYLAWVLRPSGEAQRVDLGAAAEIETAAQELVKVIELERGDAALGAAGETLAALVWAPLRAALGEGVRRVTICPDAALASVPFAALPGRRPGSALLDELALSHVAHPFDLVPRHDATPSGTGALVVGGVDYERADLGSAGSPLPTRPEALALLDRAPQGPAYRYLPGTLAEATALGERLGRGAATLLVGTGACEARLREAVKGKRVVHLATHGFARTDLLAGLYHRKIQEPFLSADAERQLAAGHDPMLLSGLALAGANPRQGGGGDDGILTALEASYLDLDGCELVTLSACETARGTAESGEGVLGLVSAFQMAGAKNVVASLWKVDDEATRLLMEGLYERLLRTERPLSPADALRESALALRDRVEPDGRRRFAAPRYWAAFVAYGG